MPSPSEAGTAPPPAAVEAGTTGAPAWRRPPVIVGALVLAAACVVRYDADARGFISGFTVAVLVVLAVSDLQDRVIPNRIALPATAIVLVAQIAFYPDQALEWILCSAAAAGFLFVPSLVRRDAVGRGDVALAALVGAALGTAVLSALTLGFLLMVPVAAYMFFREGAAARGMYLPLGPFLAVATVVVLLAGGAD